MKQQGTLNDGAPTSETIVPFSRLRWGGKPLFPEYRPPNSKHPIFIHSLFMVSNISLDRPASTTPSVATLFYRSPTFWIAK